METIEARSLLTPTGGYLGDFTHSLNPYQGCVFGCSYCYVAWAPVAARDPRPWGRYVKAKTNAPEVLARELARHPPDTLRIFMASATDPYQPPERRLGLTRRLLEALVARPRPWSSCRRGRRWCSAMPTCWRRWATASASP